LVPEAQLKQNLKPVEDAYQNGSAAALAISSEASSMGSAVWFQKHL
jgi:hypothetical protein